MDGQESTRHVERGVVALACSAIFAGCPATADNIATPPRDVGAEVDSATAAAGPPEGEEPVVHAGEPVMRDPLAPRLISPLSTMFVSSRRPTLRWEPSADSPQSTIEICRDRECTRLEHRLMSDGDSIRPPSDLPAGVHFWRVSSREDAPHVSFTWEFRASARSAPIDNAFGNYSDYNGDGFADLVVGFSRTVRLFWGGERGFTPSEGIAIGNPEGIDTFGYRFVSSDLNGDGFSDLVVSAVNIVTQLAPGFDAGTPTPGRVYVFRGGREGIESTPNTTIVGGPHVSDFGNELAALGDLDRDGYADVAVAQTGFWDRRAVGTMHLFHGSSSDVSSTVPGAITLGTDDSFATGRFPLTLSTSGDIDGDGTGDIIAGPLAARNPFVVFASVPERPTLLGGRPLLPGTFSSLSILDHLGRCDTDADGRSEVPVADHGTVPSQRVAVYRWDATAMWVPSVFDQVSTFGADETLDYTDVRCSPDLNGDGFGDLLTSVQARHVDTTVRVSVFVIPGSASGPNFSARELLMEHHAPGSVVGRHLSAEGDADGDGRSDIVVVRPNVASGRQSVAVYLSADERMGNAPSQELPWTPEIDNTPWVLF